MSDCCSTATAPPKKDTHRCPVDGMTYAAVSERTLLQHIREPWNWEPRQMYFCNNPECPVVYFGKDDSLITGDGLRTRVGIKDTSNQAMICYCFGISRAAATQDSGLREFVIAQTRKNNCACETRNPSGKCCLKDFPKKR